MKALRTPLQSAIANIWADILDVEDVALDADFFELGGDSLGAVRMLATLEEVLLVQVDFVDFLDGPTVTALAAVIGRTRDQARHAAPSAAPGSVKDSVVTGRPPLSFAQERLWFLEQLGGSTEAYNMPIGFRLPGSLDADLLDRAFGEVVARHEALRTTFATEDSSAVQIVRDDMTVRLERVDLRGAGDPVDEAQRRIDELVSAPMDLASGPLIRGLLARVGDEEHILQLVCHHIICDGWTYVVILRELATLYDAHRRGVSPALPPPSIQFPDHARREREKMDERAIELAVAPWLHRLAGAPEVLELPTDRPRPALPSYRGATYRHRLDPALSATVRSYARTARATPFATLLAIYFELLRRHSGQEDIVVGVTTSGRDRPGLEGGVGLFASTVALRGDLAGDPSFDELVGRVRETVLWAIAHEHAPFERIVAATDRAPDLSRQPIFQVFCAHVPLATLPLDGVRPFDAAPSTARFDLTLFFEEEDGDEFELAWEYSTDLFDAATIESFADRYVTLLEGALADPARGIATLPMAGLQEPDEGPPAPAPDAYPVACMHERFERHAAERPDALAVSFEGTSISYGELNRRANRLARRLRDLGAGRETLVALLLEPSIDMIVSILGVLKAGAAYVPLDPEYPADRIAFVLEDAATPLVLTLESLLERLPPSPATAICLDRDAELLEALDASDLDPLATPDSLAYVIYTSGSTGRPKGVLVEHRNVARLFTATDDWYSFGPSDVWVLLHSYAFDFSVWEVWGALAYGGRLVISPLWTTRSPDGLAELVAEQGVTVLNATPSLFVAVQDELIGVGDRLALRYVVFGGEALAPASLRPWYRRFGDDGATLVNMYGITETTVHVTYRPLTSADCERETSPIGVPIPDLQLHLLDPHGRPVPAGVAGELYVGGAGVARGYLNRPELTAERFIEDPSGRGRLYRTGDVARRLPDGELDFRGRIDDQVKIRGFRIELGEIQAAIRDAPGVADCAVVAVEAAPGDTRLAAYVVPEEAVAGAVRAIQRLRREERLTPGQLLDLPDGTTVAHINRAETEFSYGEIFLRGGCLQHGIELPHDACVFDVGANIGMFALLVGRRAPDARIFAFEPVPPVNEALRLNVEIHGLHAVTFDCALGARSGAVSFTYFPHITIISGYAVDPEEDAVVLKAMLQDVDGGAAQPDLEELVKDRLEHVTIERPVRTISEVVREHDVDRIDLLKVDVEGAELDVLAGVDEADWPRIRQVFVEVHGGTERLNAVSDLLGRVGFALTVEQDDALLEVSERYNVFAVREEAVAPAPAPSRATWRSEQRLRESLRAHLEEKLPAYMVPASIATIERLPLTRNGKTDRKALPAPVWEQAAAEVSRAPETATERQIAEIWTSVLGVASVGAEDNFFNLGGHSLLAARVVTQTRTRCEVSLSVRALFESPTLAAFAAQVDAAREPIAPEPEIEISSPAGGSADDRDVGADSGAAGHPLSFPQQQLLFFDALDPGSVTYNASLAVRVRGELQIGLLRVALERVLKRHTALRTVLMWDDSAPHQVVLDRYELQLDAIELPESGLADPEAELRRRLEELARRPFDLSSDLMLRATVVTLSPAEHVLLFQTHHVAFDAWAVEIFYRELGEAYAAAREGRAAQLPELPFQYRDFAVRQRERLSGELLEHELDFWRAQLAGAPTILRLPTDRRRPPDQTFDGATFERQLDAVLTEEMRELCTSSGVSPYMLLMATFTTLLYRRSGQDDILLGGPMANRDHPGFENLIGFFANTVVVRARMAGNPTFSELLVSVRDSVLASYEHQEVPLELVVDAVNPQRDPGVNPLFQVNFRVRIGAPPVLELPGAQTSLMRVDLGLARFDLALELHVLDDGITAEFNYNTALWDAATIERLADDFEALLRQVVAHPDRRLLALQLSDEREASVASPSPPDASGIRGFRREAAR